eukprot:CAMPEP_0197032666 /NCGR_PEP_ID=MMETSP1384-20130603/11282_1 /TAXON_ID=29189 /ORGANISM="Ammonia sp." /LENGTH=494 /DNA_ID=CAMNT_0042462359 /DNA_START=50 /DNA_END=1534 /DNA_ORIENTATION=-
MTFILFISSLFISVKSSADKLHCNIENDAHIDKIIAAMLDKGYSFDPSETGGVIYDRDKQVGAPLWNSEALYGEAFFGPDQSNNDFRINACDILLFRGCTPPKSTYFGYRSYMKRPGDAWNGYLGSSMGDTLNDEVIRTECNDNNYDEHGKYKKSMTFDSVANIATTADMQSFMDLQHAYHEAGVSPKLLNLDSIPIEANFRFDDDVIAPAMRTLNNGEDKDELQPLLDEYMYGSFKQPVYVFHCDASLSSPRIPMHANLRETKVSHIRKTENTPKNRRLFEDIVAATKHEFTVNRGFELVSEHEFRNEHGRVDDEPALQVSNMEHGFWCIENGVDCAYDNRDTHYSWPVAQAFGLDDDTLYVVVGLNHNAYRMTRYNKFCLYYVYDPLDPDWVLVELPKPYSILNHEYEKFDIADVIGTSEATQTLDAFITSIARPHNCLQHEMASLCLSSDAVGADDRFIVLSRAHLNPRTSTMPDDEQMIGWRLLQFAKIS